MSADIEKPVRLRDVLRFWQRRKCGRFSAYAFPLADIAVQLSGVDES